MLLAVHIYCRLPRVLFTQITYYMRLNNKDAHATSAYAHLANHLTSYKFFFSSNYNIVKLASLRHKIGKSRDDNNRISYRTMTKIKDGRNTHARFLKIREETLTRYIVVCHRPHVGTLRNLLRRRNRERNGNLYICTYTTVREDVK
jgi:hypothetical protein